MENRNENCGFFIYFWGKRINMRLAAIYIKKHFLFSEPQTINLGGKYFYTITARESIDNEYDVTREENPNFIERFWGENISLVSALVGENGAGKTSVLKIINNDFRENSKYILLFESDDICFIQNRTGNKDENDNIIKYSSDIFTAKDFDLQEFKLSTHETLYFSNIYDRGVKKISSFLPLNSNNLDENINEIEDRNLIYQVQLMNSRLIDKLKNAYQDFPNFDFLQIKSNPLSKWDLRKIYIDTNIGFTNILKKVRDDFDHEFERLVDRLNEGNYVKEEIIEEIQFNRFIIEISKTANLLHIFRDMISNTQNKDINLDTTIEEYYFKLPQKIILERSNNKEINGIGFNDLAENHKRRLKLIIQDIESSASITNLLDEVWEKYPVSENSNLGKTHTEDNLLRNFEVNILSLLILNDTYGMTGLQATSEQYDYSSIRTLILSKENNFSVILNEYLKKYLAQSHGFIYSKLVEKFGEELLYSEEELIKYEILQHGISSNGVKIEDIRRKMNHDLKGIFNIKKMYNFLKENLIEENVKFNTKSIDILVKMQQFININQEIRTYFHSLPTNEKELFYYNIGKNFSYGEKALLNLFAQFFEFKSHGNIEHYGWKNLNILLDEADLGFHPEWKRKFMCAITTVFSIMFSNEKIQLIISTHDALTLSDIPNNNVVYLRKDGDKTKVLNQNEKPKKSFGANITDLLADSFFIKDGLIGDFAKKKIEEVIKFLKQEKSEITSKEEVKKIIELVDEPLLKGKFREMYYELFPNDYNKEKEIEEVKIKAIELGIIKE